MGVGGCSPTGRPSSGAASARRDKNTSRSSSGRSRSSCSGGAPRSSASGTRGTRGWCPSRPRSGGPHRCALYAFGEVSGGHFNPAVTLSMALSRRMPISDVLPSLVAQVVGGLVGIVVIFGIVYGWATRSTSPRARRSAPSATRARAPRRAAGSRRLRIPPRPRPHVRLRPRHPVRHPPRNGGEEPRPARDRATLLVTNLVAIYVNGGSLNRSAASPRRWSPYMVGANWAIEARGSSGSRRSWAGAGRGHRDVVGPTAAPTPGRASIGLGAERPLRYGSPASASPPGGLGVAGAARPGGRGLRRLGRSFAFSLAGRGDVLLGDLDRVRLKLGPVPVDHARLRRGPGEIELRALRDIDRDVPVACST